MDNNSFQNFVMQWLESLFNGAVNLIDKIINANGTYEAVNDGADGYKKVVVNVPQPTGTKNISITQNGTTTENVNDYKYAEITASVPNTYAAGDEGKVVSNGALVAQTAHAQVTQNGTYDTTLNNSVEVAVPQGAQTGFFEGFIEVMDVYRLSVATIPVDVSDYDYVLGSMYVVATGDVSDGVVTLDDTPTITAANGDMAWLFNFMHPTKTSSIYNNQTRTATAPNITYVWTNATSGTYLKSVYNSTLINGNTIQIKSSGDYMVQTGRYTKFKYEVVAFKL